LPPKYSVISKKLIPINLLYRAHIITVKAKAIILIIPVLIKLDDKQVEAII
jgi:hypothetical protein